MPGLPGYKGAQPISPGLGGTGPREIDQLTRRIDALRLVVRDLGEQLPRTDLPPEASCNGVAAAAGSLSGGVRHLDCIYSLGSPMSHASTFI